MSCTSKAVCTSLVTECQLAWKLILPSLPLRSVACGNRLGLVCYFALEVLVGNGNGVELKAVVGQARNGCLDSVLQEHLANEGLVECSLVQVRNAPFDSLMQEPRGVTMHAVSTTSQEMLYEFPKYLGPGSSHLKSASLEVKSVSLERNASLEVATKMVKTVSSETVYS